MVSLPAPLKPLENYAQFILHVISDDPEEDKKPLSYLTGYPHDPHDPAIWMPFEQAASLAPLYGAGIGFVITEADPFFFLDIDDALRGDQWSDLAQSLCAAFAGCAVEVSKSGTGLHVIGSGQVPPHSSRNEAYKLEFYTRLRYVALTGNCSEGGSVLFDATHPAQWLVGAYFPPKITSTEPIEWTDRPDPEWNGPADDGQLLARMLASVSAGAAFSTGRASPRALWFADADALAVAYPGNSAGGFDHSTADAALCQHLAFWTGRDCERMDRMFRESALMRDKWDMREDYRRATIGHAVGLCENVYTAGKPKAETVPEPSAREGYQYLTATQQLEHFAGCVYVRDAHRVFVPDGAMLKPEQFKATYGGYLFAIDSQGHKEVKNAFEAFTESQSHNFPKVHGVCFRPEVPSGQLIQEEGRALVNIYVPILTDATPGDVGPFLTHLAAMLPDPTDQQILLSYMAAVVQYPGIKFQWAPLLQGAEGNGKTLFIRVLAHAVGHRYTHLPNAADLSGNGVKFNAWIASKLFIGVEELYSADRRELSDALKPLITNDRVEIQGKGADQITGDNRANFMLCSNYKDAVLKTDRDRRYCVFYTAQQTAEDMAAEGWTNTGGYFQHLYEWAREGGYAAVNHYLRSYAIPDELNPATQCHRAPVTSSTTEAVILSLGRIEQEVLEAVEEGRVGFAGGWISSAAFDRLLEERRDEKRIPPNKRRQLLQSLGYDWHPALKNGRVNASSAIDFGKKPRLYIKRGSLLANLTDAAGILHHYIEVQQGQSGIAQGALGHEQ